MGLIKEKHYPLLILVLSALFFIPFLGGAHLFDWDEVNFAEMAREMIVSDNFLQLSIDFRPFYQKPPLFIWMQAFCMKLFGVDEFAARLPNAICGIVSLQVLFAIGKKLFDARFGLIWAGIYMGSILPHFYFRSGIIDPWFNLFIFLGLYFFVLFFWKKEQFGNILLNQNKWLYLVFGGLLLGMGILTKGPVAYLIVGLVLFVYWVYERFRFYVSPLAFILYSLAASGVTLAWFGIETLINGPNFVFEFTKYQYILFSTPDAGHAGFPGYHFVILLLGCFPASIFALRAFAKWNDNLTHNQKDFTRWMKILFWVVLILFTIVKSKIVHYSSLCYFPITYLAAVVIDQILNKKLAFSKWMLGGTFFIGGVFILLTGALPFLGQNIEWLQEQVVDARTKATMDADVIWTYWDIVPSLILLVVLFLFFYFRKIQKLQKAFISLFLGSSVFVGLGLIFFINNIEAYSQRAAIDFFKSKQEEDCYVATYGYKSYAQLFYKNSKPELHNVQYNSDFLINGAIDKDVYFVCHTGHKDDFEQWKHLEKIDEKNGFVFFKRTKPRD